MFKIPRILTVAFGVFTVTACGPSSPGSQVKELWNEIDNPALIAGMAMVANWNELPRDGQVSIKGWSDDYWATAKGGVTYRWQTEDSFYRIKAPEEVMGESLDTMSPAEKYDIFMGRLDFPTVIEERARTRVMKINPAGGDEYVAGMEIPAWEGLCHGWAPAAINFLEPQVPVKIMSAVGELTFYPSDLKAMLTYYQQYKGNRSTRNSFVSGRCRESFATLDEKLSKNEITEEQWKEARNTPACADVNPGAFHLVISNEIGLQKKSFVVDVTRDAEVWNQPVNSYSTHVLVETNTPDEAAAAGTVKELTVQTDMKYTVEMFSSVFPLGASEKTKTYQYILELNAADEIIGGRWISEDRPDFLWRESAPEFRGYFANLQDLYEKSLVTTEPNGQ